jgi:hypothetical protein
MFQALPWVVHAIVSVLAISGMNTRHNFQAMQRDTFSTNIGVMFQCLVNLKPAGCAQCSKRLAKLFGCQSVASDV